MIAALLLAGAMGGAADSQIVVAIAGKAYAPARLTVLAGEQVRWTNQDPVNHTVTAADRAFDSGALGAGASFSRRFDAPGTIAYKCSLHSFMRGTVEVVAIELRAPEQPVPAGEPAELTGRAPGAGATVALERDGAQVGTAVAGDDGRFRFPLGVVTSPARYRARSEGLSSAVAEVAVAPQVRLAARRGKHGVSVRVHTVPAQPGGTVVLERHERERFGFVRLGRRGLRLDATSRARSYLPTSRRLRLRARLVLPVGGYARATSAVVVMPRAGGVRRGGHH